LLRAFERQMTGARICEASSERRDGSGVWVREEKKKKNKKRRKVLPLISGGVRADGYEDLNTCIAARQKGETAGG
jgi:hypothetical protein